MGVEIPVGKLVLRPQQVAERPVDGVFTPDINGQGSGKNKHHRQRQVADEEEFHHPRGFFQADGDMGDSYYFPHTDNRVVIIGQDGPGVQHAVRLDFGDMLVF